MTFIICIIVLVAIVWGFYSAIRNMFIPGEL